MGKTSKPALATAGENAAARSSSAHVGVAALERGLSLLCVLDAADGLSLSEAARRAKLNKTTAFRLMRSLERNGFVTRDEDDRYRFGARLLELTTRRKSVRR